jgi:tetratricopeptide (TPR) repeat protein
VKPALRKTALSLTCAVVVLGLLLLGGRLLHVWRGARQERTGSAGLEELLRRADLELAYGYQPSAGQILKQAAASARSEQEILRVLKRTYGMARTSGDYGSLAAEAEASLRRRPKSATIAQLYVYAELRSGGWSRSAQRLLEGLSGPGQGALQLEAFLRDRAEKPGRDRLSPGLQDALAVAANPSPPAQELELAAGRLGDPRLRLDAALLWMGAGEPERGYAVVAGLSGEPGFAEAAAFMALDAGNTGGSLSLLESHPELLDRPELAIVAADLCQSAGNEERALVLYRQALQSRPDYSWIPYLNLAALLESRGGTQEARSLRQRAFALFPQASAVAVAHARDLGAEGRPAEALELLAGVLKGEPRNLAANLLELDLRNRAAAPVGYRAALWELAGDHPEDRALCQRLFNYLLGLNDLAGAQAALQQYQEAAGLSADPWLLEKKGILEAVAGNYQAAGAHLRQSLQGAESWRGRYNLALVLQAAGRPADAKQELILAETGLLSSLGGATSSGYSSSSRSLIRSRIAELELAMGQREAAMRECAYALDLDPDNLHARQVLSLVEGYQETW